MTVRCWLGVWLDSEVFNSGVRTGFLESRHLRRKHHDLQTQALPTSREKFELELGSRYKDWGEEIGRVRTLLAVHQARQRHR